MFKEYKTLLKIRKIVPLFIWKFIFEDKWNHTAYYNSLQNPPFYGGVKIKWKNIGFLLLIIWLIFVTVKVI